MSWLKKLISADVIRQVLPEEPAPAPVEKQDVVLAYGPDSDAPAAEQLRNLAPVTPQQMAAPEGPGPSGYQYYSGNLADVGFGQVNPALYGEPKVMNYFNPVTGQYFTTATPLPESIVPEAWSAYVPQGTEIESGFFKGLKTTTEAPDRSEYIPNALQSTGKGVATMAPAEEILAMRQGRPFGQSQQRQYGYRQPQQMPVRQAPVFRPDTSRLNGDFMDMIRKYADKSMVPALPKFQISANQPQQFAAGGSVMGQRGYSEMEASPKRVGFKKWTVPTKQVAVKGVMYNPTTGQYFEVDSSTPYQYVPEGWKFTMTPGGISTAGETSKPSEMAKLPEQYQQKAMNSIAENQQMMLDFLKKNRMGV